MAVQRRRLSPFSLSFLDIMFCGFGAVVLLVLVLNAGQLRERRAAHQELADRVERQVEARDIAEALRRELTRAVAARREAQALTRERLDRLARRADEVGAGKEAIRDARDALRQGMTAAGEALRSAEQDRSRLAAVSAAQETGRHVLTHPGEGRRQYLTGLRLGGRRVLLLVDRSASMLDRTLVNVLRRRNMDEAGRLASPKWRQVRQTVHWLIANLPPESSLQLGVFSRECELLPAGGGWVRADNRRALDELLAAFNRVVPAEGTSLGRAFSIVQEIRPMPDNIVLLTDGLPTLDDAGRGAGNVSGAAREKLFLRAQRLLPRGIPVNTILFPLEGDPKAAVHYWRLAVETGGSFFTPTRDWP